MSGQKPFVAMGVVAVFIVLGGARWLNQQEKPKAPKPNPHVLLEREYWRRIYPILLKKWDWMPDDWVKRKLTLAVIQSGEDDATLERLFAARRCGLVSQEAYAAKLRAIRPVIENSINVIKHRYIGPMAERQRRRLEWFSVFGKADLETPVGLPPPL